MIKVYVAGKLNDDAVGYIINCHKMIKTAKLCRDHGYAVYVPCIDFLEGLVDGEFVYKDYFDNSQPWLKASDAVFLVPGWETSEGTKKEIYNARMKDIPVFNSIIEMDEYFNKKGQ
jgi:hypothetical protein